MRAIIRCKLQLSHSSRCMSSSFDGLTSDEREENKRHQAIIRKALFSQAIYFAPL